jgi:hypothetical protein
VELGQPEDAWCGVGEAMTAIETTEETWCEVEVNRIAGEVVLVSPGRDATKAEAYFERALSVARQQQAKSWELRAAMSLGRLWRAARRTGALRVPAHRFFASAAWTPSTCRGDHPVPNKPDAEERGHSALDAGRGRGGLEEPRPAIGNGRKLRPVESFSTTPGRGGR